MTIVKKLAASTALALALTFGAAGIEVVSASPAVASVREATPVAGRFCKNSEAGKVVGNLICKYDPAVNRNRWVVK